MSGICGWIGATPAGEAADPLLERMRQSLRDPSRHAAGTANLVAGSGALTGQPGIRPVSVLAAGPLLSAVEGRVRFRSPAHAEIAAAQGAAAAVAAAYAEQGPECLQGILGPYTVAVVDTRTTSGLLAIDRLGTRTMTYACNDDRLVFGSTADSVVAHPGVSREISRQAIFNYLYCHVVPSPGTIYGAIRKLLPGQCVTFANGKADARFYWRLPYDDGNRDSIESLERRFHELLRVAARNAVDDKGSIGAFLSGGTDSSTVTALLTEVMGAPARTYSIGFAAEGFDEMNYARISARKYGAKAHEYYATPNDIVEAIPIIARAYDEPFGNDSAAPTYLCARMAREDGVDVMLAGDGGDELFGGNVRYAKQKVFEAYARVPGALRRGLIEPVALSPIGARIAPLRKIGSYVRQASVPLPDRLESYNFLNRAPLAEFFEPDFLDSIDAAEPLALLRDVYGGAASKSAINRMMHLDLKLTLADNDLRKVTRMCDVAGIEVRYPLLDDDLVEFSGEVPAALKVKGLKLRHFFKQALKDTLPPETIAKTKHGFGMPFGLWLRSDRALGDLVFGAVDAFGRRGILRRDYLEQLRREHLTGHATYFGIMLWVIAMLECWLAERKL